MERGTINTMIAGMTVATDEEIRLAEEKRIERARQEKEELLARNYLNTAGIPLRYMAESLETYKPTKENNRTYQWVVGFVKAVEEKRNTKNLLYISGTYGTGKTHLGCGMIRRLGGRLITSLELCITYDSCRDFTAKQTRIQFLQDLCRQEVLVIDEVGKGIERIEKEILPYIVDQFYGSRKILVCLGNGSKEEYEQIIGGAGADRMKEAGVYFALVGESMRGQKK